MLKNRIKNSVAPDEGGEAEVPTFLAGFELPHEFTITRKEMVDGEEVEVAYNAIDLKPQTIDGIAVLQRDFVVQAAGDGYISYYWTRTLLEDGSVLPIEGDTERGIKYILTEDTHYSGEKLYYTLEEGAGGLPVYKPFGIVGEIGQEIPEDIKEGLYEKVGYCYANTTGIYTVKAVNKKGHAQASAEQKVLIPGPDKDTFEVELPEGQELSVYLTDGAEGAGTATVGILGKTAMVQDTEANIHGDTIVYTWAQGEDITEPVEVENVAVPVAQEYTIADVPVDMRAQYDENITASVYATRNGDSSEPITTVFRITDKAHAPIVELGPKKNYSVYKGDTVKIQATVPNYADIKHTGEGDEIVYQWYKIVKDDEGVVDPLANDELLIEEKMTVDADGVCTLTFDTNTTKIKDAETGDLVDAGSGVYYCKVINKVNKSEAANDLSGLTIDDCISIVVAD